MGLKKLYIYIIKTFIPLFLGSFAVAWFIVVMHLLWRFVGDIVGKGVDTFVLLKLMFYAAMTMVPLGMVLGVLIGSLMAFGSMGEKLELLAMKSAGIPLIRIFRPLVFVSIIFGIGLFVFQNDLMITSQVRFWQYYFSIKNKSPELAIPEGVFYKDIQGYSIYVERKDFKSQMLYGMMIYDYKDGFQNAAVITADSGKLYTATEDNMLVLELYSGESFRNLRSNDADYRSGAALVPYMRETFGTKEVRIPFDASLDMVDESLLSSQFVGKNMFELKAYTDSLAIELDSVAAINRQAVLNNSYNRRMVGAGRPMTTHAVATEVAPRLSYAYQDMDDDEQVVPDIQRKVPNEYVRLGMEEQEAYSIYRVCDAAGIQSRRRLQESVRSIISNKQNELMLSNMHQSEISNLKRKNEFEYWRKFTYPVAVIAFFFIGAPLGSVIRKGGLGVPFIVGVFVFLLFYILEVTGIKMSTEGRWEVWAGMWLPNMVLLPLGALLTIVASRDATHLSPDAMTNWMVRVLNMSTARRPKPTEGELQPHELEWGRTHVDTIRVIADDILDSGVMRLGTYVWGEDRTAPLRDQLDQVLEETVLMLTRSRDLLMVHRAQSYPYMHLLAHVYRPRSKAGRLLSSVTVLPALIGYLLYLIRYRVYLRELKNLKSINQKVSEEIERILSRNTADPHPQEVRLSANDHVTTAD